MPSSSSNKISLGDRLKQGAKKLKTELRALQIAAGDLRVPWYAKLWLLLVIGYALSPIDLIPDFIPVLGYLDDLLLLPFGIWLAIKLIPPKVMMDCRSQAITSEKNPPSKNWVAAGLIVLLWIISVIIIIRYITKGF